MIMSKDVFVELYKENCLTITGHLPDPTVVDAQYAYFQDAAEGLKAEGSYPVFEPAEDGTVECDKDGNPGHGGIHWQFHPVWLSKAPIP